MQRLRVIVVSSMTPSACSIMLSNAWVRARRIASYRGHVPGAARCAQPDAKPFHVGGRRSRRSQGRRPNAHDAAVYKHDGFIRVCHEKFQSHVLLTSARRMDRKKQEPKQPWLKRPSRNLKYPIELFTAVPCTGG